MRGKRYLSRGAVGWLGRPKGQVVAEQLHDEGSILVALLVQVVEVLARLVKCLAGERARVLGEAEDLIVKDAKVEGEAEPDRVRRRQVVDCEGLRRLVARQGPLSGRCLCICTRHLPHNTRSSGQKNSNIVSQSSNFTAPFVVLRFSKASHFPLVRTEP